MVLIVQFAFVAFVILFFAIFVKKYNEKVRGYMKSGMAANLGMNKKNATGFFGSQADSDPSAPGNSQLPDIARALGLTFEAQHFNGDDEKTLMHMGGRIHGEYKGIPVEMKWYGHARESQKGLTRSYSYSYKIEKTTTFTVKNLEHKSFEIMPKSDVIAAKPTGLAVFDEKLILIGDRIVPHAALNYFAKLGWMDLTLKGTKLVFNDTFMEQFKGVTGSLKMMSAVHPIYHSSPQKPMVDTRAVQKFFDEIVELVKGAALV